MREYQVMINIGTGKMSMLDHQATHMLRDTGKAPEAIKLMEQCLQFKREDRPQLDGVAATLRRILTDSEANESAGARP